MSGDFHDENLNRIDHELFDPFPYFSDLSRIANITLTEREGQVTSLNYPNSYPNNVDYSIRIVAANNTKVGMKMSRQQIIVIWLEVLDIEYQESCLYDYIEIKETGGLDRKTFSSNDTSEGNQSIADAEEIAEREGKREVDVHLERICGKIHDMKGLLSQVYFTSSNEVSLRFHSDHSNRGNGFLLKWQSLDTSNCDTWFIYSPDNSSSFFSRKMGVQRKYSVVELFERNGSIASPGYPNWLIPSQNCSMRLMAPPGYKVRRSISCILFQIF